MVLQNRIISAPLGSLTDKSVSGIGMIIRGTSGSVPGNRSRVAPGPYCFENMLESGKVRDQVVQIKQRGAKAEFELCHVGQYAKVKEGDYAIGPTGFIREDGVEVKAMDEAMMEEVADAFAKGARDAREYGFDMVMLHFAHGWLPTQFLSPYYNRRTDAYGGSFENRIRFPVKIVERVREAVGPGYPLDMRISLDEHLEGGTSTEEIIRFLQRVEDKLDMVHVSAGVERDLDAMSYMSAPAYFSHGINTELSRCVKKALHIPVAVVGSIMTPQEAEDIIAEGKADAVVIGRSLIADPFWVQKAREGRSDDIVPCIRCLNCYNMYMGEKDDIHYGMKSIHCCSVNPRYLHENRVPVELPPAREKKKVAVIGGGPAGMKAAVTAALRGHEVTLFEKNGYLGGQLHCSEFDEAKMDLKRYKDFLIGQVHKHGVQVCLHADVNRDTEALVGMDAIIVAVGAEPVRFKIGGMEKNNVLDALQAYEQVEDLPQEVVIVGGGSIGSELAKRLCHQGRHVSVVDIAPKLCANLNEHMRAGLMLQLKQCENLDVYTETSCEEIREHTVILRRKDGTAEEIPAACVILAVGMRSRTETANSFYGIVQDTNVIGDANRVGTVYQATSDGYYAAASL